MIRFLLTAAFVAAFIWFGLTVNLGKRTLFGHVANIWSSDEAGELKEDVKHTTEPLIDKAKDGARKGIIKAMSEDADGGGEPAIDAGP